MPLILCIPRSKSGGSVVTIEIPAEYIRATTLTVQAGFKLDVPVSPNDERHVSFASGRRLNVVNKVPKAVNYNKYATISDIKVRRTSLVRSTLNVLGTIAKPKSCNVGKAATLVVANYTAQKSGENAKLMVKNDKPLTIKYRNSVKY
jgi:uncharacterized NAD-dependent epimerase/dehydratase family protein